VIVVSRACLQNPEEAMEGSRLVLIPKPWSLEPLFNFKKSSGVPVKESKDLNI
jgi:hypothetical protein